MRMMLPFLLSLACWGPGQAAPPPSPFGADPQPSIVFPDNPVPSPKPPDPSGVPVLPADTYYIVTSPDPIFLLASPQGLVSIAEEKGPITIRGKFVDGDGRTATRKYGAAHVYLVEPLVSGRVELFAVPVGTNQSTQIIRRLVDVQLVPPPPPTPPAPPVPPAPPAPPAPIPDSGNRVLFLWDKATEQQLTKDQQDILYAPIMRDYLDANTVTEPNGWHGYRIWDSKQVPAAGELAVWKAAFARPRQGLPWMVASNGKTGYEGPLPATVAETQKLLDSIFKGSK